MESNILCLECWPKYTNKMTQTVTTKRNSETAAMDRSAETTSPNRLKMAVVGTGYLGRFHAQKYHQLAQCELIAISDVDAARATAIADELSTVALSDHRDLIGKVDAVSVASPTTTHYAVARDLLEAGIHVLVEKPITVTVDEAEKLIQIARKTGSVLQVGHLERFNPALLSVANQINNPLFIESHRLAPFNTRGADVNVVLDLMIHDIDIIMHLVDADVTAIHANGAPIVSGETDIANARLEFSNGCVANVTASRVSGKVERRMRFFQKDTYVAVDFQENTSRVCKVDREQPDKEGIPVINCIDENLDKGDAIRAEIEAFVIAINTGSRPLVSGEDGLRALKTAIEIGHRF